jgi:endo-1,4-beta-xylanase
MTFSPAPNRRQLLMTGLCAGLASMAGATAPVTTLAALAKVKGIRFGSTVGLRNFADSAYRALTARECALVVPENEMKWVALRPDAHRFDSAAADRIVGWARANHLGVRGHTLLWHSEQWMPA